VLFSRIEDGVSSLWTYRLDTGEERQALAAGENLLWWDAAVSRDGTVAVLGGPSDISAGLYVGSLEQGSLRQWMEPGRGVTGFSWSASGSSLIAAVDRGLVWLAADQARPLVPRIAPLDEPALSPDGATLVAVNPHSSHELVSVDPDGGGWSCVLCGVPDLGWGSVAADGALAYRHHRGGVAELVVREPDGSTRLLTPAGSDGWCPSFSPDGRRIAFLSSEPGRGRNLQVISRDGGEPVTLATEVEGPEYPSWSPDGRFLAYAAGTPIRVWVVSAAGGEPRLVTPDGGDYPEWSPDGRWIAYVVWTDDSDPNQGAWVVEAEGGAPLKIADYPTRLLWSPDGSWLFQLRQDAGRLELWQSPVGAWRWSKRSVLDAGIRASVHEPYRPLTVHPTTGDLIMNRKASADALVVFEGIDSEQW
jgi:Tol biopolymer transport system component